MARPRGGARQEKALVFTQFREMTAPLARFLGDAFGRPGLVLSGETRELLEGNDEVRLTELDDRELLQLVSLDLRSATADT
jgi:hypothetical protein